MKKWIAAFLAVLLALTVTACGAGHTDKSASSSAAAKNPDVLVVYYSEADIMNKVATDVGDKLGARVVPIRREKPFPSDIKTSMEMAREEAVNHTMPAVATKVPDIRNYKTIFLCYPVWWGTAPMPVFSFLSQYDLSGITIVPIAGIAGKDKEESSVADLRLAVPNANIEDGYLINSPEALQQFDDWLADNGYVKGN